MKAEFGKFGPKHDYRGAHVALRYGERNLLGEIVDTYWHPVSMYPLKASGDCHVQPTD